MSRLQKVHALIATILINSFAVRALLAGRDTRNKLVSGLVAMYRDNDVDKYYDASLLDTYGWTLLKMGQIDRALERIQQSVSIRPSAVSYYHLAVIFKQTKDKRQALQALHDAEKLLEQEVGNEQIKAEVRALIEELGQE